ncbi:MAG: hypothetical protein FWE80_07670 [Oscillospiraceae bacterium]|nr:hypothetical protein [Oscillospiraceae bacterium]
MAQKFKNPLDEIKSMCYNPENAGISYGHKRELFMKNRLFAENIIIINGIIIIIPGFDMGKTAIAPPVM